MYFFNIHIPFTKKPKIKTKSAFNINPLFNNYQVTSSNDVDRILALIYYGIISAVSIPIDFISDEFQTLELGIWDIKNNKFVDGSQFDKLLYLLNHPNSDQTLTELLSGYSRFYNITGNSFLVASKNVRGEILELVNVNPCYITIEGATKDSYVDYYTYQSASQSVIFSREEDKDGFRFFNKDRTLELWQVKDFTNKLDSNALWGLSRLNSIYLEINQFFQSNVHNLSVLRQGVRSSGILSFKQLTQDQRDSIRAQVNADKAGSTNAGRLFVFDGEDANFKELSQSMKDMDFKDLKESIESTITTRFKMPRELLGKAATYENQYQAKLSLYDNVILPLGKKLLPELSLFTMPSFKIDPNAYTIKPRLMEVEVLKERELQNVERLKKINIKTTNELRAMLALEPVDGGDKIYQSFNLVGLGEGTQQVKKIDTIKTELKKIKYANGDDVYKVED